MQNTKPVTKWNMMTPTLSLKRTRPNIETIDETRIRDISTDPITHRSRIALVVIFPKAESRLRIPLKSLVMRSRMPDGKMVEIFGGNLWQDML